MSKRELLEFLLVSAALGQRVDLSQTVVGTGRCCPRPFGLGQHLVVYVVIQGILEDLLVSMLVLPSEMELETMECNRPKRSP